LIVKESDNNVKLIVLDRLITLKDNPSHEKVLRVSAVWNLFSIKKIILAESVQHSGFSIMICFMRYRESLSIRNTKYDEFGI